MLLLSARLGHRSAEVAWLELDDIDWRCGEVTVRGKGHRQDRLPLPADVGAALATYLCARQRPQPAGVRDIAASPPPGAGGPVG